MELFRKIRHRPLLSLVRAAVDRLSQSAGTFTSTLVFRIGCWVGGVKCGRNLEVFGPVIIRAPAGQVRIGDRVQLVSTPWRATASGVSHPVRLRTIMPSAAIILEEGAGMSGGSITARSKTIRVGQNTMIGPDCLITDSDFHQPWPPDQRREFLRPEKDADVSIGRNVWLGARCIVLKGVTIGDNAVVAAGSVVVENVPANSLAGGNPARVIRHYPDVSTGNTTAVDMPSE